MSDMETKLAIKDSIFESVLMGTDVITVLRSLHLKDGYKKEDIIEAFNEMKNE